LPHNNNVARILLEYFWFKPRYDQTLKQSLELDHIPSFDEVPSVCRTAMVALMAGVIVGIGTSGLIPYLVSWRVGIYAFQAWVTSGITYMILRTIELNRIKSIQQKLEAIVQVDPLSV
jgi:hypothetical protein